MQVEDQSLVLPITTAARQMAAAFSAQQATPDKAQQVRLNTLAVWVTHDYLQMMGIPCNLDAGDSWNPVVRTCSNVADLEVAASGRLECRPVQAHEDVCYLPPEVWVDRIGYLVVQISENLRQARLLGFTPTVAAEYLQLDQLRPLESLLAHLSEFSLDPPAIKSPWTQLELWFSGLFADGWQPADALLCQSQPALSFRRAEKIDVQIIEGQVQRAKLLSLRPDQSPVVLVLDCKPGQEQRLFCVQVHPLASDAHLPADLQLVVFDEGAEPVLGARSRSADDYIQLQFSGHRGERFSLKVMLGDFSVTEQFVI
ncbi:MAG: DUF1822 family protein [Cyanobacteria bacterium P01_A01_bin.17]